MTQERTISGDALSETDAGCCICFGMWGQVSGRGCMAIFVFNLNRLGFREEDRRIKQGRDFLLAQPAESKLGTSVTMGSNHYLAALLRSRHLCMENIWYMSFPA